MTLVVGDRIQETTTTTGTGTVSLLGAVTQFQSFATGVGNGNSTYYTIADQSGVNWEEGIGTYTTSGSTLTRTVIASSNANALVNFPAGTKNVFCSYPAGAAVLAAPYAYPTVRPSLNLDFVNSKQLDQRVSFSRASTATYYDGKTTAMAEQNLLTYSQDFSNAVWTKQNSSIGALTIAPDGSNTATTITATATSIVYFKQTVVPVVGSNYTISRYVKSGTKTFCTIGFNTLPDAFFDLTNLTYSFTGTGAVSASITDVGNGWRLVTATWTATATATSVYLAMASSLSSSSGLTIDDTLYYWGAQLEQRSSATAYTPTTSSPITNYIPQLMTAPAGVARFDHDPLTGKSLGLLVEESRTNLLTYSQDFGNAAWSKTAINIDPTPITAPDGTNTGSVVICPTIGLGARITQNKTATSTSVTFSVYAKAPPYGVFNGGRLLIYNSTTATTLAANGFTSSFVTTDLPAIPVGNGWYRIILTVSSGITIGDNIVAYLYTSYGSSTVSNVSYWGAQLEAGTFATSYIPTTSAAVTRAADQASMTGTNFSSWYNQSQGSWLVNAKEMFQGGVNRSVLNGLQLYINVNNLMSSTDGTNYTSQGTNSLIPANTYFKGSLTYGNSIAFTVTNGGTGIASLYNNSYATQTSVSLGSASAWWSKLAYYPKALSSIELQGLTTL